MNPSVPSYSLHERIWHWLQATAMMLLIVTGMAIHYPDRFGVFGCMANAVRWHWWIGLALIVNAFLGIFYHLTADKYHHFLPRMDDFTEAAVRQARFYLYGIFKGEPHPFEHDERRKLNPLQKITYLARLNVLLPFQIATGVLMWGADRRRPPVSSEQSLLEQMTWFRRRLSKRVHQFPSRASGNFRANICSGVRELDSWLAGSSADKAPVCGRFAE